jgi:hypothetical protein
MSKAENVAGYIYHSISRAEMSKGGKLAGY